MRKITVLAGVLAILTVGCDPRGTPQGLSNSTESLAGPVTTTNAPLAPAADPTPSTSPSPIPLASWEDPNAVILQHVTCQDDQYFTLYSEMFQHCSNPADFTYSADAYSDGSIRNAQCSVVQNGGFQSTISCPDSTTTTVKYNFSCGSGYEMDGSIAYISLYGQYEFPINQCVYVNAN